MNYTSKAIRSYTISVLVKRPHDAEPMHIASPGRTLEGKQAEWDLDTAKAYLLEHSRTLPSGSRIDIRVEFEDQIDP